jgi:hypothetical protein
MKKTYLILSSIAISILASLAGYLGGLMAQRKGEMEWLKLSMEEPPNSYYTSWLTSGRNEESVAHFNAFMAGGAGTTPDFVLCTSKPQVRPHSVRSMTGFLGISSISDKKQL